MLWHLWCWCHHRFYVIDDVVTSLMLWRLHWCSDVITDAVTSSLMLWCCDPITKNINFEFWILILISGKTYRSRRFGISDKSISIQAKLIFQKFVFQRMRMRERDTHPNKCDQKKNRQMSKSCLNDFTRKMIYFNTFTKIAYECGRFGQINCCQRL